MKTERGAWATEPDPAPPRDPLPPFSRRPVKSIPSVPYRRRARSRPTRRDAHLFGPGGETRVRLEGETRARARGGAPPTPATFAEMYSDPPSDAPPPPSGPPPRVILRALAAPSIREVRAKFEAHTLDAIDARIAGRAHRARSTGRKTALARAAADVRRRRAAPWSRPGREPTTARALARAFDAEADDPNLGWRSDADEDIGCRVPLEDHPSFWSSSRSARTESTVSAVPPRKPRAPGRPALPRETAEVWSRAPRSEASDEEAFVPVERMHPRERRVEYVATTRDGAEDGFGFGKNVGGDARALRERLTREGVAEIRAARAATREAAAARRGAEAARRRAETAKAVVKRNRSATEATRTAARRAEASRRRRTRTESEPTPRPEPEPEPEPAVGSDDAAIGRNETPSAAGPARGATSASPESIPPESAPPGGGDFPSRRLTPADLRLLELAHDPGAFPGGLHFTVANIDRLARAGELESTRRLRNLCRRAGVAVGDDASGNHAAGALRRRYEEVLDVLEECLPGITAEAEAATRAELVARREAGGGDDDAAADGRRGWAAKICRGGRRDASPRMAKPTPRDGDARKGR